MNKPNPDNKETVLFGDLAPDGTFSNEREIARKSITGCPFFILMPTHYRANGICRCDDPTHMEMAEWGYVWDPNTKRWS